jgi:hypothetical protein
VFEPDPTAFPGNIVQVLIPNLRTLDPDVQVVSRPIRTTDDVQCIGVFISDWIPDEGSIEMRAYSKPGLSFPTLSSYEVTIQGLVVDTEEERGIATHSALAKRIRLAVAVDPALRVALAALTSPFGTQTERVQRWGVPRQRYLVNELNGTWFYLSETEFRLTTETT